MLTALDIFYFTVASFFLSPTAGSCAWPPLEASAVRHFPMCTFQLIESFIKLDNPILKKKKKVKKINGGRKTAIQHEQRNPVSQNYKFQIHLAWEGDNKNIQKVIKKYSTIPTAASYRRSCGSIHPVHSYHS